MKIGFIIYHGMTALDFIGVYDPLIRLKTMGFMPQLRLEICAYSSEVKDGAGLVLCQPKCGSLCKIMTRSLCRADLVPEG